MNLYRVTFGFSALKAYVHASTQECVKAAIEKKLGKGFSDAIDKIEESNQDGVVCLVRE